MKLPDSKILRNLQKSKYWEMLPSFKEEKIQKFTSLTLTLVALSFFALFAISPTLSTIAKLQKELEDNKFVDKQLQTKINNLSVLQQKYNQIEPDIPFVLASIPKTPQAPELVGQLQSLAASSNLAVDGIQATEAEFTKDTTQKDYSYFSFIVSVEGNYSDIIHFITSINSMQRIVYPEVISITKKSKDKNVLLLNFRGRAYYKN